jgi:hypothetical protein
VLNSAVGHLTQQANTTGSCNTSLGAATLFNNTAGSNNTAIGRNALAQNTTGVYNTATGSLALCSSVTGVQNTATGYCAGASSNGGDNNTFIGALAGQTVTTGNNLTLVGRNAGFLATSASSGVALGSGAQFSSPTITQEVNIWNGAVAARFQGAAGSWSFVSDERDKSDIVALPLGLEFIKALEPRKFKWDLRNDEQGLNKGKEASGFIAQEVLAVTEQFDAPYTGLVDTNDPEQYTFAAGALMPMVVNALKELAAENAELRTRIETLEANG